MNVADDGFKIVFKSCRIELETHKMLLIMTCTCDNSGFDSFSFLYVTFNSKRIRENS